MKSRTTLPYRVYIRIRFGVGNYGCWIWTGAKGVYGLVRGDEGQMVGVHCYVYKKLKGEIPAGKVLDHIVCDEPLCCNPTHVAPRTSRENILRGRGPAAVNARKTRCRRGHSLADPYVYTSKHGTRHRHCRKCRRMMEAKLKRRNH